MCSTTGMFAERADKSQVEEGLQLAPKFDENGLLPAIATDADTGDVLMVAFMNEEALRNTIETGEAHFYSRSRKKQWKKGESSGHVLQIQQMRIDCDQDCVWMKVRIGGGGAACHVGYTSCFYREIPLGQSENQGPRQLNLVYDSKSFDPNEVYGKQS